MKDLGLQEGGHHNKPLIQRAEEKLAWLELSRAFLTFSHLGLTSAISFAVGRNGMGPSTDLSPLFPRQADTKCVKEKRLMGRMGGNSLRRTAVLSIRNW